MTPYNTLNIVMDEKLEKVVRKLADDERRSMSAQICYIVEKWLEESRNEKES